MITTITTKRIIYLYDNFMLTFFSNKVYKGSCLKVLRKILSQLLLQPRTTRPFRERNHKFYNNYNSITVQLTKCSPYLNNYEIMLDIFLRSYLFKYGVSLYKKSINFK